MLIVINIIINDVINTFIILNIMQAGNGPLVENTCVNCTVDSHDASMIT